MIEVDEIKAIKNQNDYEVDGLLYCGNCNTPKECKVKLNGRVTIVGCLCKCEIEANAEEEQRRKQEQKISRIKRLRDLSFYDSRMKDWNFKNDDGEDSHLSSVAMKYVENFDLMKEQSKGLLFYGGSGSGKSYMAACIVNALIDMGIACSMTNFSRISNDLWNSENKQEVYRWLNMNELLVIDDFTAERQSEYMNEIVFNVIDERYRSGLPLIVTTNLQSDSLIVNGDITHDRIISRLSEMCMFVRANGDDRRIKKLAADHKRIGEILGL